MYILKTIVSLLVTSLMVYAVPSPIFPRKPYSKISKQTEFNNDNTKSISETRRTHIFKFPGSESRKSSSKDQVRKPEELSQYKEKKLQRSIFPKDDRANVSNKNLKSNRKTIDPQSRTNSQSNNFRTKLTDNKSIRGNVASPDLSNQPSRRSSISLRRNENPVNPGTGLSEIFDKMNDLDFKEISSSFQYNSFDLYRGAETGRDSIYTDDTQYITVTTTITRYYHNQVPITETVTEISSALVTIYKTETDPHLVSTSIKYKPKYVTEYQTITKTEYVTEFKPQNVLVYETIYNTHVVTDYATVTETHLDTKHSVATEYITNTQFDIVTHTSYFTKIQNDLITHTAHLTSTQVFSTTIVETEPVNIHIVETVTDFRTVTDIVKIPSYTTSSIYETVFVSVTDTIRIPPSTTTEVNVMYRTTTRPVIFTTTELSRSLVYITQTWTATESVYLTETVLSIKPISVTATESTFITETSTDSIYVTETLLEPLYITETYTDMITTTEPIFLTETQTDTVISTEPIFVTETVVELLKETTYEPKMIFDH